MPKVKYSTGKKGPVAKGKIAMPQSKKSKAEEELNAKAFSAFQGASTIRSRKKKNQDILKMMGR